MTRAMQFGLGGLTGQATSHDRGGYGAALRHVVDLAVTAETSGFDGAWTSEHHFVDDGYLPSPLLPLVAIAERTTRITLGTQVMLAPLYSPVKLAEDTAVLDQLSGGRLCLGIGLGYQGKEYKAFGTTATKRVAALERCVHVLRQSWRGEPVDIGDDEQVSVRPLPRQEPGPAILLGAIAEAGVRRSARIADGFVALDVDIAIVLHARTGRNQAAHDHVLFQAAQIIDAARDRSLSQHAGRLLERRRRNERVG